PITNQPRPVNLLEIANKAGGLKPPGKSNSNRESFNEVFKAELSGGDSIRFSKHAEARIYSRGIKMDAETVGRLVKAIAKAEEKGSKETLILDKDSAYVVSVKNKTVITVFDKDSLRQGVVTAIDSAVIM
ncbi:MAG: flagellar biosynthesis protein, partial [candidate division Zixibacteria bacterium]|nr:flagellar biosynthesis protein [candidate division Zixibacteria bacterium]